MGKVTIRCTAPDCKVTAKCLENPNRPGIPDAAAVMALVDNHGWYMANRQWMCVRHPVQRLR